MYSGIDGISPSFLDSIYTGFAFVNGKCLYRPPRRCENGIVSYDNLPIEKDQNVVFMNVKSQCGKVQGHLCALEISVCQVKDSRDGFHLKRLYGEPCCPVYGEEDARCALSVAAYKTEHGLNRKGAAEKSFAALREGVEPFYTATKNRMKCSEAAVWLKTIFYRYNTVVVFDYRNTDVPNLLKQCGISDVSLLPIESNSEDVADFYKLNGSMKPCASAIHGGLLHNRTNGDWVRWCSACWALYYCFAMGDHNLVLKSAGAFKL